MAEVRSDKSPFQSRFGGGWISAAQYLAESMCDRKARSKGKSLPQKFWETDEVWRREFALQARHVSGLLRLYSTEAIIRALRTPQGKRVYSFGAKWLDPIIVQQQRELDVKKELKAIDKPQSIEEPTVVIGAKGPRPQFKRQKTTIDKLRELDG